MSSITHSYYEWQISTLMLAYDAIAPLPREDTSAHAERQQACEKEAGKPKHNMEFYKVLSPDGSPES